MKVLIVDENSNMVHMLSGLLKHQVGIDVLEASSLRQVEQGWQWKPDLVLIDPLDDTGIDFCTQLRKKHDPLILAMSRDRANEAPYLENGADAYIQKPFLPEKVLAHIHALARRPRSQASINSGIMRIGNLTIDSVRNQAQAQDSTIALTTIECRLLWYLANNAPRICSYALLVDYAWNINIPCVREKTDTNLLKVFMFHLRKKLATLGRMGTVENVVGTGYQFIPAEEQS
jgi:DNA-binding response OmpR family regulator